MKCFISSIIISFFISVKGLLLNSLDRLRNHGHQGLKLSSKYTLVTSMRPRCRTMTLTESKILGSSAFLESFIVRYWGLFDDTKVYLDAKPGMFAFTGETGAGKSVLISSLEHICMASTVRKAMLRPNVENQSLISLSFGPKHQQMSRFYNEKTKRSWCELNGKKVTNKELSLESSSKIRFWSSKDSLLFLTGAKVTELYIDPILGSQGLNILQEIRDIHDNWSESYSDLIRLRSLNKRMQQGDLLELLTFYIKEISSFETRIYKLIIDLIYFIKSSIEESLLFDMNQNESSNSPFYKLYDQLLTLENNILIKKKSDSTTLLDLQEVWNILESSEDILSTIKSTKSLIDSSITDTSSSSVSSNSMRSKVSNLDLNGIRSSIQKFNKNLNLFQKSMEGIGPLQSDILNKFENIENYLQDSLDKLDAAVESLEDIKDAIPSVSSLLQRIQNIQNEWGIYARKHSISPIDLEDIRNEWMIEMKSMGNISTELPLQEELEYKYKSNYIELATKLSKLRKESATMLSERVNHILPNLELADKSILIEINSTLDDNLPTSTSISTFRFTPKDRGITRDGWDEVKFKVHTSDGNLAGVETVLSTGEFARLALGLETCVLDCMKERADNSDDGDVTVTEGSSLVGVVVYDEIDAHVGGEAAAAVARLLKEQGKSRQVLVITHNPVIAAVADKHFVVSRKDRSSYKSNRFAQGTSTASPFPESEVICLTGVEREQEISRMATGKLNTDAGMKLAQALLNLDYSQRISL
eukprot:gene5189-10377_t